MDKFDVTILGCGSALPTTVLNQTSQIVNFREKLFMIDCGEGTQLQFRKAKLSFAKLKRIFISHLHGDHCFGLLGLISTFGMLGRTADMHIHCPIGLEKLMKPALSFFCNPLPYKIFFHEHDTKLNQIIYENRSLIISTIPLKHRIPCAGFLFQEKPKLKNIRKDQIDYYNVPISWMGRIKAGDDFVTENGEVIANDKLTLPEQQPRSYAYCSDTAYYEPIIDIIQGTNLLFHEATFATSEEGRASQTNHSTAKQAATIAKAAGVKKMLIGHFSARYTNHQRLLDEALTVFKPVICAQEMVTYSVE